MIRAASAQACEGLRGHYEAQVHHLVAPGEARLDRFVLGGKPTYVENTLDLPNVSDPFAILGSIEHTSSHGNRLKNMEIPAITTILRYCNRRRHADGEITEFNEDRPEIAARIVWLGRNAAQVTVDARMFLDNQGIGRARAVNAKRTIVGPVVSAPLTEAEARYAKELGVGRVFVALPSSPECGPIFVAVHSTMGSLALEGETIERLYIPEPGRYRETSRGTPIAQRS